MLYISLLHKVAATYGQGAYGCGPYEQSNAACTGSSTLANTGMPVVLIGTVGVALLLAAGILFMYSRKSKGVK